MSDNVPLVTFDDTDPSSPVFYMDIQTANLIADAPLLLAEVERLREIEREWKQMWSKLEDYPDMCAELICFMESGIYHMRNYKALEGVVKSLRWTLGDKDVTNPLD